MYTARYGVGDGVGPASTTTVAEEEEPLRGRTNWGDEEARLLCENGVVGCACVCVCCGICCDSALGPDGAAKS